MKLLFQSFVHSSPPLQLKARLVFFAQCVCFLFFFKKKKRSDRPVWLFYRDREKAERVTDREGGPGSEGGLIFGS